MGNKLWTISVIIIIIISMIFIAKYDILSVKASDNTNTGNVNGINNSYIYNVTQTLSNIINNPGNSKGRFFGTNGEHYAGSRIQEWMAGSDLWTTIDQVSSEYSQEFKDSGRLMNFSEDLQVNNKEIVIYNSSNNTYMNITDCYIHPRWNETIKEFFRICKPYDQNQLTHVFNEKNLEIKPRPSYLSKILNYIFINHSSTFINNSEIMSGNTSALIQFIIDQLESDYNITFEELFDHPENASKIPGFTEDTYTNRGDYVFIGEDMAFNPNYNHTYWDGWNEFIDFLYTVFGCSPDIQNLIENCRTQKQCVEVLLWSLCPNFKGLVLYDHNNDTYDMCYNAYYARPTLYINRSVGLDIINNLEDHFLNYTIDQVWNENVESYNVIGQLNSTVPTDPNEYVLIACLYDGWNNQASADSAIGMGVLLAIARYFNDHHITPKTNIRFVAFSGEEAGGRGAFSYEKDHEDDSIPLIIDLNQFGFSQSYPRQALWIFSNNATENVTLHAIAEETNFVSRVNNATDLHNLNVSGEPYFSDHTPFYLDGEPHTIISFLKENTSFPLYTWRMHHRDGLNHQKGDSMAYYNPEEVNATASLIFNVTRYYTINPDCWFSNVSLTALDSLNDGDALNDSIQVNFTIHSVLPSDKVRVELNLSYSVDGIIVWVPDASNTDIVLTSYCQNESILFTIPDSATEGNYSVSLNLYNSTGRINNIVSGSTAYNDSTGSSGWYHLYHPLGYTKRGVEPKCINDNVSGSVFTANEEGRADNITAFINQLSSAEPYTCMLYRANDSALIGTTTSDWVSLPRDGGVSSNNWWAVFNFTGTKPLLEKGIQYVITCWGDSNTSRLYYTESGVNGTGRYMNHVYGAPPDPADFINESRYYSLYCSYTPDVTAPQIMNITDNPHTIGFGSNVTITVNVTDRGSGVNLVQTRIVEPGGQQSNNTMEHLSGNLYRYVFSDSWVVGQCNFSIWTQDNETNSNISMTYHFHVSANASMSIATLKNSYSGNQFINITDPPNPPENITVVDRGLTWNTYYNASTGENILETYQGPVNYQEDNGTWTPINNTLTPLESNHPTYIYGYRNGNDHGLYGVYFKSNAQQEWPIAFAYNKSDDPTIYAVRSKLVGVGYVDPQSNWTYQYLQNVQSSQGQTDDYSITYPGVFTGADVTWSYGNTGLKEEITMSNATKAVLQNHPPSQYGLNDASSYLVFITKLDHQNLNMYNASGMLTGNVTISDTGVDFKDVLGQFKCALPLGEAYELNNESARQKLTYRIVHLNGNTFLLSGLKLSGLNTMTFPVVIDPTLTVYTPTSDGFISKTSGSYNTAWTASSGTISDSASYISIGQKKDPAAPPSLTYTIYRGFVFFNTTVLPSNAYLDNATLSVYKKDDYSATDFDITIQNGQPAYPDNPLQTSDYSKSLYTGNGGALNTSRFGSGYNAIRLNDLTWINKTGVTKLCLRSSRDINGNAPTGNEYINVYSNEFLGMYPPRLVINYRNQSKIKNIGSTDIKGYLLIQIQSYNTTQSKWLMDNDTINETTPRTINSGNQLALDAIFNGKIRASNLQHGTGTYRVYTAFRDPEGNILRTNDDVDLEAWWQFSKT